MYISKNREENKITKEVAVTVRFTEAEHADLVEKVKKAQCKNKSDFIRRVVSGVVVKERIPKELRHDLFWGG
ncbi:hypothetical protein BWI93_25955 [Siphonobacter sp. BAB-5385]|uniref:plasmid mobilization protein n=1 Tax=Siphonobacter sp. BAB-5385 TaxID=1864822 RepID=UPI000B9DD372|nr:hypothetical protein [Siphonobacter sp. BAB-5385]OZI05355.1 hypothetical protein BWI93_25955 [Siphonobacter sp. BAB-5385]